MRSIRKATLGGLLAATALLTLAAPAGAHVHGFTPLACLEVDSSSSGAAIGFDRAADAAAPMHGETPIIPRNASGKAPSGGQGAANACG